MMETLPDRASERSVTWLPSRFAANRWMRAPISSRSARFFTKRSQVGRRFRASRPPTFDSCGLRNRLDYILFSQSLLPLVTGGGVFRKGLWGSRVTRPTNWDTYTEMAKGSQQASDHGAVFIDLNI